MHMRKRSSTDIAENIGICIRKAFESKHESSFASAIVGRTTNIGEVMCECECECQCEFAWCGCLSPVFYLLFYLLSFERWSI